MINKHYLLVSLLTVTTPLLADIKTPRMPREMDGPIVKPSFRRAQEVEKKRELTTENPKRKGLQGLVYKPTYTEMTFDELMVAKNKYRDQNQWSVVIKYLERMITLCDKINQKAELIIELADAQLDQGFYDDAAKKYKEFMHLYPGNDLIEHASYKAILCTSQQLLSYDRDQSKTEETLELTKQFLERSDLFTLYKDKVIKIQNECYALLAQHEMYIGEFYLKQGDYNAAQGRLKAIRSDWLPKVPEIALQLTSLESELAIQFPDFKLLESTIVLADATKDKPKKKDMAQRF